MVERQLLTMTPEFCWKLYKGNDDPTTVLLAKVQMSVAGERNAICSPPSRATQMLHARPTRKHGCEQD